jgi:WD40 repeat protein
MEAESVQIAENTSPSAKLTEGELRNIQGTLNLFQDDPVFCLTSFEKSLKDSLTLRIRRDYGVLGSAKNQKILKKMNEKPGSEQTQEQKTVVGPNTEILTICSSIPLSKENNALKDMPKAFLKIKNPALKIQEMQEQGVECMGSIEMEAKGDRQISVYNHDESGGKMLVPSEPYKLGGILTRKFKKLVKPQWHAPWKLSKVIAGHTGWVRCIAVDPSNEFFVTGSSDKTIKFWDLATGKLKITLTGHINSIRALSISKRHCYLFSCGDDKKVLCWDLETNKVVREYHGHLSGVYSLALHPTLNILASGGRDATVRLWDMRTRLQIKVFEGHKHTVSSLLAQEYEPQFISGSHDTTVRLWDTGSGKCANVLTNHKKSIRSMALHHSEYTFVSGAGDNLKVWKCPEGSFVRNFSGHNSIINTVALNRDNVLVSGSDNGSLYFWDWNSGYNFQQVNSTIQPGSISAEAGIFGAIFDNSSLRLLTCECDKSIKIWQEDENATPETHPIDTSFRISFDKNRY